MRIAYAGQARPQKDSFSPAPHVAADPSTPVPLQRVCGPGLRQNGRPPCDEVEENKLDNNGVRTVTPRCGPPPRQ